MSVSHPIIAVTGSSGAGTSTVKNAFEDIFRRASVKPVVIEGDSFHRFDRKEMRAEVVKAEGGDWSECLAATVADRLPGKLGTGLRNGFLRAQGSGDIPAITTGSWPS